MTEPAAPRPREDREATFRSLRPQRQATEAHLGALFGAPETEPLTLTVCHRLPDGRLGYTHHRTVGAAVDRVNALSRTTDVWIGVCPLTATPARGRGGEADTAALVALVADFDRAGPGHKVAEGRLPLPPDDDALGELLADVGASPTVLLETGGGWQAWWLLVEPWVFTDDDDRRRAATLARRWGATMVAHGRRRGWHVDNVGDLARVLRPAGSANFKTGEPRPVRVLTMAPERRYTAAELAMLLADDEPAPVPTKPNGRNGSERVIVDRLEIRRGPSFADALAERLGWGDILEPHGWTLVGTRPDGSELWRHPTATAPHSATAGAHGVPTFVAFSGLRPDLLGPGRRLTKWRLFSALNFPAASLAESERSAARYVAQRLAGLRPMRPFVRPEEAGR